MTEADMKGAVEISATMLSSVWETMAEEMQGPGSTLDQAAAYTQPSAGSGLARPMSANPPPPQPGYAIIVPDDSAKLLQEHAPNLVPKNIGSLPLLTLGQTTTAPSVPNYVSVQVPLVQVPMPVPGPLGEHQQMQPGVYNFVGQPQGGQSMPMNAPFFSLIGPLPASIATIGQVSSSGHALQSTLQSDSAKNARYLQVVPSQTDHLNAYPTPMTARSSKSYDGSSSDTPQSSPGSRMRSKSGEPLPTVDIGVEMLCNSTNLSPYKSDFLQTPIMSPKPVRKGTSTLSLLSSESSGSAKAPQTIQTALGPENAFYFPPVASNVDGSMFTTSDPFPSMPAFVATHKPPLLPSTAQNTILIPPLVQTTHLVAAQMERRHSFDVPVYSGSPAPSIASSLPTYVSNKRSDSVDSNDPRTATTAAEFGLKLRAKWERKIRARSKSATPGGDDDLRSDDSRELPNKAPRVGEVSAAPLLARGREQFRDDASCRSAPARSWGLAPIGAPSLAGGSDRVRRSLPDLEARDTVILPKPPTFRTQERSASPPSFHDVERPRSLPQLMPVGPGTVAPPPSRAGTSTPPSAYSGAYGREDDINTLYGATPPDSQRGPTSPSDGQTVMRWLEGGSAEWTALSRQWDPAQSPAPSVPPVPVEPRVISRSDATLGLGPSNPMLLRRNRLPSIADALSGTDALWETGSNNSFTSRTSMTAALLDQPALSDGPAAVGGDRFTFPPPPAFLRQIRNTPRAQPVVARSPLQRETTLFAARPIHPINQQIADESFLTDAWVSDLGEPGRLGTPELEHSPFRY